MTAFDSPLLVSKAAWLYARPVDRQASRPLSDSQQRLLTLLEGRRRRYLARKEEGIKLRKKRERGDESTNLQQTTPVLSVVDDSNHLDVVEVQRRESPTTSLGCSIKEEMTTQQARERMRDEMSNDESLLEPTGLSTPSTPKKATRDLCTSEVGVLQRYGEH